MTYLLKLSRLRGRLVAALGFALLCPALVLAQTPGKISGTVTDAADRQPLPGVNIVIEGSSLGVATDVDGHYYFANVRPGEYTLRASMVGYADKVITEIRVHTNTTAEINFEMQETTILGEEVVVTAQRPLIEKDNTTSMIVLESRELTARPTSSFTDILATLPGINVEDGQMRVRGGTLDEVAFMVDGARARNPMDHSPYTRVNLSSIQEVEVITGAFNAEYGEAQSGVVNVITKEGGDRYEFYIDNRYTPPGLRHWGTSLYDQSTDLYWENTHARHLDWWIEYPDQWVDPNGVRGSDPRSMWTPEEAYEDYIQRHQPLTRYTEIPTYQTEVGIGGPFPLVPKLYFYGTAKYRSEAPLFGNSYRDRGEFGDGTLKLTYRFTPEMRIMFSGFYGQEWSSWGIGSWPDYWYALTYGVDGRYAYYDFPGLPESITNGQTVQFTHVLNPSTMYELSVTRVSAYRKAWPFPDDPIGWEATDATRNNLRAVDEEGNPIPGGYANRVGFNTTGYYFRYDGNNTDYLASGFISSQLNRYWQVKSGFEFSQYILDHYNESKFPNRYDDRTYRPYQGAVYAQNKLEFGGLIMNAGLRFDFYNPNDRVYENPWDPLNSESRPTSLFSQLSPRIGVSHPIDERTKLHFSYGHFFQRSPFGDYGEGNAGVRGSLTTFIVEGSDFPWVLGNRNLRPTKTTAYEVGVERNFWNSFLLSITGYYKDIRNTIRMITVETPQGVYQTNGNGDYADFRGVEFSLRKMPTDYQWGSAWGYFNYTMQGGVSGRSGDPVVISPRGPRFGPSGDYIVYSNPRIKAGLYYGTPRNWNFLGGILGDVLFSFDYEASLPNEQLRQDFFLFNGEKYMRPAEQNVNMRARKDFQIGGIARFSPYVEVNNLFNQRWINLAAFESASQSDQQQFVESGFEYLPTHTANDIPILDTAKFRNLRRSFVIGVAMQF